MIQIERPNMNFVICNCLVCFQDPIYYKIENGYFILAKYRNYFTNNDGLRHRLDGYAVICIDSGFNYFYINGNLIYSAKIFAKETGHLICKNCNNFCKQKCF